MERLTKLLVSAALLAPLPALAAAAEHGPMGHLALYATQTSLEIPALGNYDEDEVGFGVKGWMAFGVPFVHFEYQTATLGDDVTAPEIEVEQLRIGGGAALKASDAVMFIGKAEYISQGYATTFPSDFDLDGFGVHAGAMFMPAPALHLGASIGYLMLTGGDPAGPTGSQGDTDGIEINLGAGFNFTKQFGAFIDYRTFMGAFDAPAPDDEWTLTDIRIGGTFSWGM
jgi:hypothetical protein